MKTNGYAAQSNTAPLTPFHFTRRELRDDDVAIKISHCGVCHSDLHMVRDDWAMATYPLVPGHEIVGQVIEVGAKVKNYSVGDSVGVGCLVDSCATCKQCEKDQEQYCQNGFVMTYGSEDKESSEMTQGGYSQHIVVKESFVLRIPDGLDLAKAAPILCAGVTTYSPLKHWNVKKGSSVGVIGLGGLGHMAVKIAVAMGASVTAISRSDTKKEEAKNLGAQHFLNSKDDDALERAANTFDVILDTVPVKHDINPYVPLLDVDGTLVILGQMGPLEEPVAGPLVFGRRQISGSLIGGIAETQEVIDFCAKHKIMPECEMIGLDQINQAFEALENGDIAHRFVIDMSKPFKTQQA